VTSGVSTILILEHIPFLIDLGDGTFENEGLMKKKNGKKREFNVVIERDSDGYFVASVPELRGCHTQAKSLDALMKRVREAIEICLDEQGNSGAGFEFVGVQRIAV